MSNSLLMRSAVCSVAIVLIAAVSIPVPAARGAAFATVRIAPQAGCPDHYYLGNNPSDSDAPDWSDNAQGIANDGRHWYFTHKGGLLKYQANWEPLSAAVDAGHVMSVGIPAELADKGINHYGDPDHYEGYIFVPFESDGGEDDELVAVIAVFRASDLQLVDWVNLEPNLRRTGWLAIDPVESTLYTSTDVLVAGTPLMRYSLNLPNLGRDDAEFLDNPVPVNVADFDGSPLAGRFEYMQGGAFTPWGDLYLSVGKADESDDIRGGLHLLRRSADGTGFRLVESSVNEEAAVGAPVFSYEYDSGFTGLGQEPEGLDWWSRDAAPDSPYPGQLHAVLLDNQIGDSNIWLKHYRVLYVCKFTDDSDGDGVTDGDEVYGHNTHPLLADTDRDGQSDGHEVTCGSDPLNAAALASDADADRLPDCLDADDDNDGYADMDETACGSDPADPNSRAPDLDGDLRPDCVDTDDDNDGAADSGDVCPATPLSLGAIQYEGCDSGVPDFLLAGAQTGCSVSQWIEQLAAASRSKGQLVSQVDKLLVDLQKQGRLLPQQKDSIKTCIAQ
jgi:hypothetical protein